MQPTARPSEKPPVAQPGLGHPTALAITALVAHNTIARGASVTVKMRSAPRAHLALILSITRSETRLIGKGRQRRRVTSTVVLYRQAARIVADAHGRGTIRLRVAYNPPHTLRGMLTIMVEAGHSRARYSLSVNVLSGGSHGARLPKELTPGA